MRQPGRDPDIGLARRRVAARVIVDEDETGGAELVTAKQNPAEVDLDVGNAALGNRIDGEE